MGLSLAPYFFCLHYFGPTVTHSRFSTYCTWVCLFSLFGLIQARLLLQGPLYEPVSHSFLPLGLNGFFLLANFGLPMLLGLFSYWALSKMSLNTRFQRKKTIGLFLCRRRLSNFDTGLVIEVGIFDMTH